MSNDLIERYWVDSPKAFERKTKEIVTHYPNQIKPFELCKTSSGIPVLGFLVGQGKRHAFLLGRVHGHEPAGTCGLVALMEGLAREKVPGSEHRFKGAQRILNSFKLNIFPMLNPDAAERFSSQIRDSFPSEQLEYSQEDFQKLLAILHEPGLTLNKRRLPHYSPEETKILEKIGKPMGTLFTEDGVELWKDWAYEKAPQTSALKKLMCASKPVLLVDVHQHYHPTTIFTPTELHERDVLLYKKLGGLVYESLEKASIPIEPSQKVEPYIDGQDVDRSVSWAYENSGTIQFLYEIDDGYRYPAQYTPSSLPPKLPTITKEQIVLAVWYGIMPLLLEILHMEELT